MLAAAMAEAIPALEKLVTQFVQDVRRVAEQAARDTLMRELGATGATTSPAKASATAKARSPAAGRRRTDAALDAAKEMLLTAITTEPGRRFEEIRTALGRPRSELERPLRKLVAEGAVRSKGVKRATRYFPATQR